VSNRPSTIDVIKGDQFGYDVPLGGPTAPYRQELTEAELERAAAVKEVMQSKLRVGVWVVEFTKVDGTAAVMECTLDPRHMPPGDAQPAGNRPDRPNLLHVYAVDRDGWRSFRVLNVSRSWLKPEVL